MQQINKIIKALDEAQTALINQDKELRQLRLLNAKASSKNIVIENLKIMVENLKHENLEQKTQMHFLENSIETKDATIKRLNSRENPDLIKIKEFIKHKHIQDK